jgi:hypothetical protein
MTIKLYGTFHKDYPHVLNEWLQPMGVNGYNCPGFLQDNQGFHITELNKIFCELTTQYWVRHNRCHDHVGFYHYRRYWNFIEGQNPSHFNTEEKLAFCSKQEQYDNLVGLLNSHDAIVHRTYEHNYTVTEQFLLHHPQPAWDCFLGTLRHFGYTTEQMRWFDSHKKYGSCNMFVMPWSMFCDYTDEMFEILMRVHSVEGHHDRICGFIGERFLDFWLNTHEINFVDRASTFIEG